MTPSDLLRAAADRVRDLAAQTTPGRWMSFATLSGGASVVALSTDGPGTPIMGAQMATATVEADGAWIAALSPAVSPMIENLLRDAASDLQADGGVVQDSATEELIKLARVILGDTP